MLGTDIKDEKLRRLVKAADNVGGSIYGLMISTLSDSKTEEEFVNRWYWTLRNELDRVITFYNELAPRTKHMTVTVDHNPL